jgi:hypothetical protein
MKQLTNRQRIELAKLQHYKWLKSLGLKVNMKTGHIIKRFKEEKGDLDLSHLKVRDSIPCSNNIGGSTAKRVYATQLPAGKTISVAYNKGPYMVVDAKDFKTMGRKI